VKTAFWTVVSVVFVVGFTIGMVTWVDGRKAEFTEQCLAAGGSKVVQMGRALTSYGCLTEDGRVVLTT